MDSEKLASAYSDLEGDLRQVRRLSGLVRWLFFELAPTNNPKDGEEVGAVLIALNELTIQVECRWDENWEAAKSGA